MKLTAEQLSASWDNAESQMDSDSRITTSDYKLYEP